MAGKYGATEENVVQWNLRIRHLMRSLTTTFWLLAMKTKVLRKEKKAETTNMHELSCQNVLEKVLSFMTVTVYKEMEPYYQHLKTLREIIICKQQHRFTQQ